MHDEAVFLQVQRKKKKKKNPTLIKSRSLAYSRKSSILFFSQAWRHSSNDTISFISTTRRRASDLCRSAFVIAWFARSSSSCDVRTASFQSVRGSPLACTQIWFIFRSSATSRSCVRSTKDFSKRSIVCLHRSIFSRPMEHVFRRNARLCSASASSIAQLLTFE